MSAPLQPPEFFSVRENYAFYRPVAEFTKDETVELIDRVILYCRENGIGGLLVDITRITGLPSPSLSDVFWFISRFAQSAAGRVSIAMVAPAKMITADKIGITMAKNRGLRSDVFSNEYDATQWLLSQMAEDVMINDSAG